MPQEKRRTWVAVGSVAGALGASSCCVLPLALFSLGIGGAWVSNLAVFAPYQSYFIAGTLPLLGYGFYLTYRNPKPHAQRIQPAHIRCGNGWCCSLSGQQPH